MVLSLRTFFAIRGSQLTIRHQCWKVLIKSGIKIVPSGISSSGKHVRVLYTPLLNSKTGVYRGIVIFLIFAMF